MHLGKQSGLRIRDISKDTVKQIRRLRVVVVLEFQHRKDLEAAMLLEEDWRSCICVAPFTQD